MLGAIIEDRNNGIITQLYLNENNGKFEISGFSIENNKVSNVKINVKDIYNLFKLGNNRKNLDEKDGYDVILDVDTGLYHYFKDSKEDYERLFYFNGSEATLGSFGRERLMTKYERKCYRKFLIKSLILGMTTGFFYAIVWLSVLDTKVILSKDYGPFDFNDGISYVFNFEDELRFNKELTKEDIKNYIYSSKNINSQVVKDFLWNEELIDDVLPYYEGNGMSTISKIRHSGISIVPYIDENERPDTSGYYGYDNDLHVKDYNEDTFNENSQIAKTLGHEYIHMLQSYYGYIFIREACAEIMSHEYFMNSASSTFPYSYSEAVKYVKTLMEIIGPEPIMDCNFRINSTAIEDAVRPYFSDTEYNEFINILNLSPFYDNDEIDYNRLEELLNVLYTNKYGNSMLSDNMILAILNGYEHNRTYFRESLMNNQYCTIPSQPIPIQKAVDNGYLRLSRTLFITKEEYDDENLFSGYSKRLLIRVNNISEIASHSLFLSGNEICGEITLTDGKTISASEAIKRGYAELGYMATGQVSLEEYLLNYKTDGTDGIYDCYLPVGGSVDFESGIVNTGIPVTCFYPSISEKFLNAENVIQK